MKPLENRVVSPRGGWKVIVRGFAALPVSVAPKRLATNRDRARGDAPRAIAFCDGIIVDHAAGGSVGAYANAFGACHDGMAIFHFDDDDICNVMADRNVS